ncbi:MAG: cytochrome c family protein [Sulfuricella sp.]|nr:cytochrome c family protein [Sulfuricella sp.]
MMKVFQLAAILLLTAGWTNAADEPGYEGFRNCLKCHDGEGDSWRKTPHAKAFESLKPNNKVEAKMKAKLDPAKDYTRDSDCVGCHVTGFGEKGGYHVNIGPDEAKWLSGVSCESCHGAGSDFRRKHGEAEDRLKKTGEPTDRQMLIGAKQNFDYERACARCHLNYQGSKWAEAKPPFTPFTPAIDAKYQFDFNKAVRTLGNGNPVHTHYKLRGVFTGGPVPAIRAELQNTAQEPED